MLVASTWQITLLGFVLLDFSERTNGEPSCAIEGQIQMIEALRAPFAQPIGRQNIRNTFKFARVKLFPTDVQARNFLIAHNAGVPLCQAAALLTLNMTNGGIAQLAGAVLQSCGQPRCENERFLAEYTILGGAWKLAQAATDDGLPPPTPTALGDPAGEVINFGGGVALSTDGIPE